MRIPAKAPRCQKEPGFPKLLEEVCIEIPAVSPVSPVRGVDSIMYPQDAAALPLRSPASVMHITSACSAPPKDVRCERKDRAYEPSPQLRLLPINTGQGGAAAPQATAAAMLGGGPSPPAHVSAPAPAGASPGRSIPPPKVVVAARGVGPITEPNVNDVLSGRGGHRNVGFRSLIAAHKARYLTAMSKTEKAHITAEVVEAVRGLDPPGRFLKQDSEDGAWWDIGDVKARKKVQKAITEKRKK